MLVSTSYANGPFSSTRFSGLIHGVVSRLEGTPSPPEPSLCPSFSVRRRRFTSSCSSCIRSPPYILSTSRSFSLRRVRISFTASELPPRYRCGVSPFRPSDAQAPFFFPGRFSFDFASSWTREEFFWLSRGSCGAICAFSRSKLDSTCRALMCLTYDFASHAPECIIQRHSHLSLRKDCNVSLNRIVHLPLALSFWPVG